MLSPWTKEVKFQPNLIRVVFGKPSTELVSSAGSGLRIDLADEVVAVATPKLHPELWRMAHSCEGSVSLTCTQVIVKVNSVHFSDLQPPCNHTHSASRNG